MHAAMLYAVATIAAFFQYPTRPPDIPLPTPTPPPMRSAPAPVRPMVPLPQNAAATAPPPGRPMQAGSLAGPLAQFGWLLGHWTCSNGGKLYFSASQGGYALIEQLDSQSFRSAGRLTSENGRWYFSGTAATRDFNEPFSLTGDIVDAGLSFIDLKGQILLPGAVVPTRFVRRRTGSNTFTDHISVYVGGNWQAAASRTCRRG
jgi:hypothetical protein